MGFAFKMDLQGTMKDVLAVLGKQLVTVDTGLGKVTASVNRFERAFVAVEGVKALGRAAMWAVDHLVNVGKTIVDISAKAQDLNLAARLQLGDEGATMLQRLADTFKNTRFDDDAIKQALLPLANAGIKDEETLDAIATAAADISARFNSGEAGFEAATEALGKIALRREVGERQLAALGINEQDFLATLSKSLGTSVAAAKKAVAAGKIAAPTLLNAALTEIANKQGGALGTAALAGGQTLGATIARLSNLPQNLIKQLSETPAAEKLRQTLESFVTTLQGPTGTAIMNRLAGALDNFLGQITPEKLVGVFEALADAIIAAIPVFEFLATSIAKMLGGTEKQLRDEALGRAVDLGGGRTLRVSREDELDALKRAGLNSQQINDLFSIYGPGSATQVAMAQITKELGGAVGEGFLAGINAKVPKVLDASGTLANAATDGVVKTLGIQSPSRVFRDLGGAVGEGFALGIAGTVTEVEAAQRAMVGAAMPTVAPMTFGAREAGGAPMLNIEQLIVQSNATNARDLAQDIKPALLEMLESIAIEAGAPV